MTIDETSQADASVSTETVTNPTPPNAREMVLDLLTTHDAHELPLKALVRAGNLFGYTDQTVRVALSRLKADGVIASPARGVHALAAAGALVRENGYRSLIIVTSDYHLPRSLLEMRALMPGVELIAYPVRTTPPWRDFGASRLWLQEYAKFTAVWLRQTVTPRPESV